MAAWFSDSWEVITEIIRNGANIEARDEFGRTPLHKAAMWNQSTAIIAELIINGANIRARDTDEKIPFDYLEENPNITKEDKIYRVLHEGILKPVEK